MLLNRLKGSIVLMMLSKISLIKGACLEAVDGSQEQRSAEGPNYQ